MNKRQRKKKNIDCSSCRFFQCWDKFEGQYGEYNRCELPPYYTSICDKSEQVDIEYNLPFGNYYLPDILKRRHGKAVCKYYKRNHVN